MMTLQDRDAYCVLRFTGVDLPTQYAHIVSGSLIMLCGPGLDLHNSNLGPGFDAI